jgi:hypothetical protein
MAYYNCPNCNATIMPAEWIAGVCPRCRSPVGPQERGESVGTSSLAWESLPRLTLTRADLLSWGTVRTACAFLVIGGLLLLGSGLILSLLLFSLQGPAREFSAIGPAITVLFVLGSVIYLIGQFMVTAVPNGSGARGWMLPALIGSIVGLLCLVGAAGAERLGPMRAEVRESQRFFVLMLLGFGVGHHCLAGALGKAAWHLGAAGLGRAWLAFLCLSGPCHAVALVGLVVLTEDGGVAWISPQARQTLVWIVLATIGLFLAWFVVQTVLLRTLLTEQLLRAREDSGESSS